MADVGEFDPFAFEGCAAEAGVRAASKGDDEHDESKLIIFIKTPDRQTITFGQLSRASTVKDLKVMIFMIWSKTVRYGDREAWSGSAISPNEQVLLWRGLEELNDELTIGDYYISNRSTLHVMPRSYYQMHYHSGLHEQPDQDDENMQAIFDFMDNVQAGIDAATLMPTDFSEEVMMPEDGNDRPRQPVRTRQHQQPRQQHRQQNRRRRQNQQQEQEQHQHQQRQIDVANRISDVILSSKSKITVQQLQALTELRMFLNFGSGAQGFMTDDATVEDVAAPAFDGSAGHFPALPASPMKRSGKKGKAAWDAKPNLPHEKKRGGYVQDIEKKARAAAAREAARGAARAIRKAEASKPMATPKKKAEPEPGSSPRMKPDAATAEFKPQTPKSKSKPKARKRQPRLAPVARLVQLPAPSPPALLTSTGTKFELQLSLPPKRKQTEEYVGSEDVEQWILEMYTVEVPDVAAAAGASSPTKGSSEDKNKGNMEVVYMGTDSSCAVKVRVTSPTVHTADLAYSLPLQDLRSGQRCWFRLFARNQVGYR
jgi:hypothetical protein